MSLDKKSDNIRYYFEDLSYSIVAETGIVSDRYHLGKIMLKCFKSAPDFVMQIDGGTGEFDTFASALDRSVRCASALKNLELKCNDVIAIMGPNCLDLTMPLYAAFYLGIYPAAIDMTLKTNELTNSFKIITPKVVFCPGEKTSDVQQALQSLNIDARIVTFDKSNSSFLSFSEFVDKYSDIISVEDFKASDFDTAITCGLLLPTSGTTGIPKVSVLTHETIYLGFLDIFSMHTNFPTPFRLGILLSPIQWLTAQFHFVLSPILRYTRIQTSTPVSLEHVNFLFNKYKPTYMISSPTFMAALIKFEGPERSITSSLQHLMLGGSAIPESLIEDIQKIDRNIVVQVGYGMTETSGLTFCMAGVNIKSVGKILERFEYKLINIETQEEILEPNKPGELWVKGRSIFKGYYNNPESTAEIITEEGWLKTGDILYRDEHFQFYFVDRLKLLLKYNSYQVSPIEIEGVIIKHPGVLHVAVSGVPDTCGDLPVACVVPNDGYQVTAQEIKDLVKETLSDAKQLRGGVVFLKNIPLTSSGKINRSELKTLVINAKKE